MAHNYRPVVKNKILQVFKLSENVSGSDLNLLEEISTQEKISAKKFIFYESDQLIDLYGLAEGEVHLLRQLANGQEVIIDRILPGEFFGLNSLLAGSAVTLSARTAQDSTVIKIPKKPFLDLMKKNVKLNMRMMKKMSDRLKEANCMMTILSLGDVEKQLAAVIWKEYVHHQDLGNKQPVFQLTRLNLAQMAGSTVETTIRILKKWEKEGLVNFPKRGQFKIKNLEKFKNLSVIAHTICCQNAVNQKAA